MAQDEDKDPQEILDDLRRTYAQNPQDLDAGTKLAQQYSDLGWFNEAIEVYRDLAKRNPNNFSILLALGNTSFKRQDLEEAQSTFKKLTVLSPGRIEGWNNLGIVQLASNNNAAAIQSFKKVLELEPDNPGALLNLGNCYDKEGQAEEAMALFAKATTVKPDFSDAWFNLGNSYLQSQNNEKAIEAYKRAIRLQREFPSALKNIGVAYENINDLTNALDCYSKAVQLAKADAGLYVNLGNVATKQKDYDQAKLWYTKAVTLSPREMPGWMGLRHLALLKGDIESYCKSTRAVLTRLSSAAVAESIMILRELDHTKEALDLLGRAEKLDMKGDELDAERMLIHRFKPIGKSLFKRLRSSADVSDHVLSCLAQYSYDNKQIDEAIAFAKRCRQESISMDIIRWEGLILTNNIDDAETAIQRYCNDHDDCPQAWFLLAKIKLEKGATDAARTFLAKALDAGYSDTERIGRDPKLQELFLSLRMEPL